MGLLHTYFASTVKGLEPVLASELASPAIGGLDVQEGRLGVHFSGPPDVGARAVLWARSSLKVMELIGSAEGVHTSEDLYEFSRDGLAPEHRWETLVHSQSQTISVQAVLGAGRAVEQGRQRPGDWRCPSCQSLVFASKFECFRCGTEKPYIDPKARGGDMGSGGLTHSHYSALTVKNAVCDHLRDSAGWRPSVDPENADLPLFLHVNGRGSASLYRILSGGQSMHKRGYRAGESMHVAALRETLAAGLLMHAGYDPAVHVLCDPMAGSGTLPIEAAMIATRTAPGLLRAPPPVSKWDGFAGGWHTAVEEAHDLRLERAPAPILANDWHGGALTLAERAAHAAGVASSIQFSQAPAEAYVPPVEPTLVVTNPPWDGRLEGGAEAWTQLRGFLKDRCGGSTAWVLSGNKELTQHLRMRSSSRLRIESSGTDLAFISYDVLRPRPRGDAPPPASAAHESGGGGGVWAAPGNGVAGDERGGNEGSGVVETAPDAVALSPAASSQEVVSRQRDAEAMAEGVAAAPAEAGGMAVSGTAAELAALPRAELQARAKAAGIRANQKSATIIEQLLQGAPAAGSARPGPAAAVSAKGKQARPKVSLKPKVSRDEASITLADGTGRGKDELEGLFEGLYGA